ncbi:MAG: hypothetical protein ACREP5_19040 [Candidatus Binatia bacterium]
MKQPDRKPLAGIVISALVAMNPFYQPHVTLAVGVAAWFADLSLVLMLSAEGRLERTDKIVAGWRHERCRRLLLNNRTCKPLEMNDFHILCYSLAVKGFSSFSGANHLEKIFHFV